MTTYPVPYGQDKFSKEQRALNEIMLKLSDAPTVTVEEVMDAMLKGFRTPKNTVQDPDHHQTGP